MTFVTLLSIFLLASHVVFGMTTPAKNCLLDEFGVETCTNALAPVSATVRQSAPCSKNDMKCWCMKAVGYTNDVRRRRGMRMMLKVGPMKQLDNAVRYAGVLGDKGFLEHQQLSRATTEVGCGRFIGGENIAYNYASGDVAKACVNQWETSPGHLENILRERFEEVVVGFHFEPDGRVYCVQTFAQKSSFGSGSESDARCEPVSRSGSGSGPKPTRPSPTRPVRTRPAPTRPAPTRQRPTKPRMSRKMKNESNRACRCLELGSRCWVSLRRLSGNRCQPLTPARNQPMICKKDCCMYCKYYPNTPPCRSRSVKVTCRNM